MRCAFRAACSVGFHTEMHITAIKISLIANVVVEMITLIQTSGIFHIQQLFFPSESHKVVNAPGCIFCSRWNFSTIMSDEAIFCVIG